MFWSTVLTQARWYAKYRKLLVIWLFFMDATHRHRTLLSGGIGRTTTSIKGSKRGTWVITSTSEEEQYGTVTEAYFGEL